MRYLHLVQDLFYAHGKDWDIWFSENFGAPMINAQRKALAPGQNYHCEIFQRSDDRYVEQKFKAFERRLAA